MPSKIHALRLDTGEHAVCQGDARLVNELADRIRAAFHGERNVTVEAVPDRPNEWLIKGPSEVLDEARIQAKKLFEDPPAGLFREESGPLKLEPVEAAA